MFNDINNLPTLKDIESKLFKELQELYQEILLSVLTDLDEWLMNNRDFSRFKNREQQETTLATMFGPIIIRRRRYKDKKTGKRIALLDHYLKFNGRDSLSPFLTEMAVLWAIKGPSYRDSRDRFCDLLGYQVTSHETIRKEVLKVKPKDVLSDQSAPKKEKDILFLEVDGLHVHKQQSTRKNREIKIGIVHEGWKKRHPSSRNYELKNKSYWATLDNHEVFWDEFSRYLYGKYEITEATQIVINGDGAPWIRKGVDYFPNAIYTYDRYHLKSWIRRAFTYRTTQERRRAYEAAEANDPIALVVAIAEAEFAENDEKKKKEISDLRQFVLDNKNALRDYREIIKSRNEDLDTSWMRPMGSAESNMNLFSRRLKKQGYSWSQNGLKGMLHGMIHRFEGTLLKVLGVSSSAVNPLDNQAKKYPSFAPLLTERSRPSIGAIQGRMPALASSDQSKPYARALRGLAGLS